MNIARMRAFAQLWLPMAFMASVLLGGVYVAVQQDIRLSANDPQIQMAEDAAAALSADAAQPENLVPGQQVDLSKSLAPYVIVFDDAGRPVGSSARLDGVTPGVPAGVFAHVKEHGEDRFTWQPAPSVRSAAVVTSYQGSKSGFVLAGRSIREIEIREDQLLTDVKLVWLVALFGTFALAVLFTVWPPRQLG